VYGYSAGCLEVLIAASAGMTVREKALFAEKCRHKPNIPTFAIMARTREDFEIVS